MFSRSAHSLSSGLWDRSKGESITIFDRRRYSIYLSTPRCLQLWQLDKSLTIAIHLSKQFLPPIDYLTALWPCEGKQALHNVLDISDSFGDLFLDQRRFYMEIRQELEHACLEIGLDPPPPPNLRFSPAALP